MIDVCDEAVDSSVVRTRFHLYGVATEQVLQDPDGGGGSCGHEPNLYAEVILSVGSVIPGGDDPGFGHRGPSPEQTVLATGTARVGGPWRLTAYRSEGILDEDGDLLEAKDLPCVRFLLEAPAPRNPINGSAFCLAPGKPDFNATSIPVIDSSSGRNELVIYGFAPDDAAGVQLTAAHGRTFRSDTKPGGAAFPGSVWVIAAPPGLEAAELDWVDRSGNAAGTPRDASRFFDQLEDVTK